MGALLLDGSGGSNPAFLQLMLEAWLAQAVTAFSSHRQL